MQTPQWTARLDDKYALGEDHLGLEGAAQGYQQYLVPGIITTTDHARYFSFYCWVLYRFIFDPRSSRRMDDFGDRYYKRHEVAFILGCYSHHKDSGGFGGLVGAGNNSAKAKAMWQSGDPISLDYPYFKNRLGGFGQYYRPAMQTMGLLEDPERPRLVYRLTKRGEALAKAFESSIEATEYSRLITQNGSLAALAESAAEQYGRVACLCPDSLARGADRPLLLDAFFRLEAQGADNPHVRRRLSLGLVLDMVSKTDGLPLENCLRDALFRGEFGADQAYVPDPAFATWYQRWQMVQVRHSYTSALQFLWAAFLDRLSSQRDCGFSFGEYMEWVGSESSAAASDLLVTDYLDQLCSDVGLHGGWETRCSEFAAACRYGSGRDEIGYFWDGRASQRNPGILIDHGLRILCQLLLRFLDRHRTGDELWREMAFRPRLPIAQFFDDMLYKVVTQRWTVSQLLAWLYRDFILGQHEFIALEKLRYQEYNTLKFYYRDGVFTWAANPNNYREPLRYPTLRLYNALTILTDLGLVGRDASRVCQLTDDGQEYLARTIEASRGN